MGAFRLLWGSAGDLVATSLAAAAILVTGSSILWAYRRVLGGGYQSEVWTRERWPRKRQIGILMLLAVAIVLSGLFPGLVTLQGVAP